MGQFFITITIPMHTSSRFHIRTINTTDIEHIHAIQSRCYAESLQESAHTLLSKCQTSPQSCWLAEHNEQILAYLITHPWHHHTLPAFNQPSLTLPADANTLFLHDLAIDPSNRGLGIATVLIKQALQWAESKTLRRARLIAVQESQAFWQRHGFSVDDIHSPEINHKLVSYGADAACLAYDLSAQQTSANASC